jgi:hypothetical protein
MRSPVLGFALTLVGILPALVASPATAPTAPTPIALPGGEGGIGFDDLRHSRALGRVLVPGGRTGKLYLVHPASGAVTAIPGFSVVQEFSGGHDDGITSVADGAGLLFVTDRTAETLSLVDPAAKSIVSQTALGASPDYVRWLESARELWVSEPDSERIEVYRLENGKSPRVVRTATIEVPGGPESLVLDTKRGRAYTHAEGGTVAIDLERHDIVATWKNGCEEAKGTALDLERGFLFVACEQGAVKVLDLATGKIVGEIECGAGIDIISYSAELGHLYVPSSKQETLDVFGVSPKGTLTRLGSFPGTADSHCVAAAGRVFFCDPARGRLLAITDPFPASGR